MFGDTITLPLSSGNVTLVKVDGSKPYSCEYRYGTATEQYRVLVRHSKTKSVSDGRGGLLAPRDRHNVEVLHTIFATDVAGEIVRKTYVVIEVGSSDPSAILMDGLADWLIATSNAQLIKLLNWES